jgi:Ca2+-binding EF-hand superfamily protein
MTKSSALAVVSIVFLLFLVGWNSPSGADDSGSFDPDALFKQLDVNGDGKLTASEIPPEHRKFFERLLRVANAEKSGELTREQFDRALSQKEQSVGDINKMGGLGIGGPAANVNPKQVFRALDKNKDGKLTRDEVKGRPRIEALFDRLGKDELTLEDLETALKPGKPGGKGKKAKQLAATNSEGGEMSERSHARSGTRLFQLLDTNHDGKISREEFSRAAEIFDQLDRNQDGFLDAKELMAPLPGQDGEEMERPAPRIQRPAADGLPAAGHPGRQMIERIVDKIMSADADGDGKLSMAEAPRFLKRHFAKVDTNGDGFIDREELETFLKTHKKLAAALAGQGGTPQKMSGF